MSQDKTVTSLCFPLTWSCLLDSETGSQSGQSQAVLSLIEAWHFGDCHIESWRWGQLSHSLPRFSNRSEAEKENVYDRERSGKPFWIKGISHMGCCLPSNRSPNDSSDSRIELPLPSRWLTEIPKSYNTQHFTNMSNIITFCLYPEEAIHINQNMILYCKKKIQSKQTINENNLIYHNWK